MICETSPRSTHKIFCAVYWKKFSFNKTKFSRVQIRLVRIIQDRLRCGDVHFVAMQTRNNHAGVSFCKNWLSENASWRWGSYYTSTLSRHWVVLRGKFGGKYGNNRGFSWPIPLFQCLWLYKTIVTKPYYFFLTQKLFIFVADPSLTGHMRQLFPKNVK